MKNNYLHRLFKIFYKNVISIDISLTLGRLMRPPKTFMINFTTQIQPPS